MFHMKPLDILLKESEKDIYVYIDMLKKWQKAVNLVSNSSLQDVWNRHIVDSAQLFPLIPLSAKTLADMGSGAGFPALVLAILNKNNQGSLEKIVLIESDLKKCLFLKEVVRSLSLPVQILNQRLETVQNLQADVITARGLADVQTLIKWARPMIEPNTICLFLKGENVQKEIPQEPLPYKIEKIKSITNSNSFILKITEVLK